MEKETLGKIARYTLTPQLVPRIRDLFFSGFSFIAFFMAQIYRTARLLPPDHPYLSGANLGRFGVRHVVAEAASRLTFNRQNIDQVVVFGLMLVGLALLAAQFCMLGFSLMVQVSHAAGPVPNTFAAYFLVPNAEHDLAFVILDRVFGVPGLFLDAGGGTTCVVSGSPCFDLGQSTRSITPDTVIYTDYQRSGQFGLVFPWPFHLAMHRMFELYNFGLLFIATFIFLYFVMAVIAETVQSGTPFGRRFNHVWAPLRIIGAIGLLVPLSTGLNSAQYILLYAAKWGSGFATNGWILFNTTAVNGGNTLLGGTDTLVATPNAPPVNTLVEFATILATCVQAYERMYYQLNGTGGVTRQPVQIDAYLMTPSTTSMAPVRISGGGGPGGSMTFAQAMQRTGYGDIVVRFGEFRQGEHQTYDEQVAPLCGEIALQITSVEAAGASPTEPGATFILNNYFGLIQQIWIDANLGSGSCPYATPPFGGASGFNEAGCIGSNIVDRYLPINNNPNAPMPDSALLDAIRNSYQGFVNSTIATAVTQQQGSTEWLEQLSQLGWGGAAIWYNKVAQLNGSLTGAAYNLPTIRKYPDVMERIRRAKAASDQDVPGATRHQVYQAADAPVVLLDEEEKEIAKALYHAQALWGDHYSEKDPGGNIFIDIINAIFGTSGLFNLERNADLNIHPLAQLSAIGRSIVDTAIRNLGYSMAAGLGGGIMNLFGDHMVGRVAMIASNFLSQLAMMGLAIGFVLYYLIPLMPFVYFFFAVGGWIKGIFEAMVGVPLWALAHIRIDGNGLPGDAALGGYYLILEVFLRPILIVFGFLASISIFSAQAHVIHEIWPLVASNVTGFDAANATGLNVNQTGGMRFLRGAMDKFFFTVMYAVVLYMLALSAFKLVDLVPNNILRWMGASIASFGDQSGDPVENLVRNSTLGSGMVSDSMGSAMGSLRRASTEGAQAISDMAKKPEG